jgi:hypothetical protein
MRRRSVLALGLLSCALGLSPKAHAVANDLFNLKTPAWSVASNIGGAEWIYVRKFDGTIWHKGITGGSWISDGRPSAGPVTSGPQIAWTKPSNQNGFIQWIFVEVGNTLFAKRGSGTWVNVSSAPPGGFTSGISVAASRTGLIKVAARGQGNFPFVLDLLVDGPGNVTILNPWTQLGSNAINSAPAIGTLVWRHDVFALNGSDTLQTNSCAGYPFPCFPGWVGFPPSGAILNVSASPMAVWQDEFAEYGGPFMAVAVRVGGNATSIKFTHPTNTFETQNRGGGTIDSGVAVVFQLPNTPPRLAAHFQDGNFKYNPSGTGWLNLGQP